MQWWWCHVKNTNLKVSMYVSLVIYIHQTTTTRDMTKKNNNQLVQLTADACAYLHVDILVGFSNVYNDHVDIPVGFSNVYNDHVSLIA